MQHNSSKRFVLPSPIKRQSLKQNKKGPKGVIVQSIEQSDASFADHTSPTQTFTIRANMVQKVDRAPHARLNFPQAMKADHTLSFKGAAKLLGRATNEEESPEKDRMPMFSDETRQLKMQLGGALQPLMQTTAVDAKNVKARQAAAIAKKVVVDHTAAIASFFGSTSANTDGNVTSQNTSLYRNLKVSGNSGLVHADDSSDDESAFQAEKAAIFNQAY